MPWVTKYGKRKFEPRLPIPTITPHAPDAPWPDYEGAERINRERAEFWRWWKRHLAEFCELYLACPRVACRRNKVCSGPDAICHDEAEEVLKAMVYPGLKKALRARQTEG